MRKGQLVSSSYQIRSLWAKSSRTWLSSAFNIWTRWNRNGNIFEQSAESWGQLNLSDSEHVKHRVHLRDELSLASDELLRQFPQKRKVVQINVNHKCNQFLQIYESIPVQLWQYTGLTVIHGFCRKHGMSVRHFVHSGNKYLRFPRNLSPKATFSSKWQKATYAVRISQSFYFT